MKLNKEKFLKSELGGNLQECVTAWDHWLTELRKFNIDTVGQKYRETRKAADWCQAQFEVFQTVMRQFYNVKYVSKENITEADYLENVAYVGTLSSGKNVIIILPNEIEM